MVSDQYEDRLIRSTAHHPASVRLMGHLRQKALQRTPYFQVCHLYRLSHFVLATSLGRTIPLLGLLQGRSRVRAYESVELLRPHDDGRARRVCGGEECLIRRREAVYETEGKRVQIHLSLWPYVVMHE
jgi:hypothetical protein